VIKRFDDTDGNNEHEERATLTIGKAAMITATVLFLIVSFFMGLLISDTRAANEKKLDKAVYDTDKAAQMEINRELKAGIQDLINLHIYPEQTKKRLIRESKERDSNGRIN
jgi:large-conductance mechanosensitive channel